MSLVVNKADSSNEAAAVMDCIARIAQKNVNIRIDKLGYIMRDVNMQKAVRMQVPILASFPHCRGIRQYRHYCRQND